MSGGLWVANPPRSALDTLAAPESLVRVQDERGLTVGVRSATAPASAPLLYERATPTFAASVGGGALRPVLFVGGVVLAAMLVRKLRKGGLRG